jgi:hypothetical protein
MTHVRELIRQIKQVIDVLIKDSQITVHLGDQNNSLKISHILVATPGYVKGLISGPHIKANF